MLLLQAAAVSRLRLAACLKQKIFVVIVNFWFV
jgi:hypothetical protein